MIAQIERHDFDFQQHERRRDVEFGHELSDRIHQFLIARPDDELAVARNDRDVNQRLTAPQELVDRGSSLGRFRLRAGDQLLNLFRR